MRPDERGTIRRRQSYRRGIRAEALAALVYRCCGYRILAKRFKTAVGEIDLIAARGRRVVFIEVKQRSTSAACEAAVTPETRRRVRRAAESWLARNPTFQDYDVGFDLVLITPWHLPRVFRNSL